MSAAPEQAITPARRLTNILGGSAGNLVEWFDWFTYSSFALYFSAAFFPQGTQTSQLLGTALIFAGGFIARPLGALLLGIYADRAGRRAALALSVSMMCGGSLLIALIPTGFGIVSTLLLVCARLLQGVSVGGEYGASATYVSEMSSSARRGFWSGCLYVTLIGGQLAAMLLQVLLQHLLTEQQLYDWGWRVPFAVGAVLAVVVFWIRRGIHETDAFTRTRARGAVRGRPALLITRYPRETGIVLVLTAGGGVGFYTYTTYMQKLLVNSAGFDKTTAAQVMTFVLATFIFFPPLVGWIADHVGRKRTMAVSFIASALLAVPFMTAMSQVASPLAAYFLCLPPLFALAGYCSLSAIMKADLYPAEVRTLGVALPYSIALAIFGGNAEAAALYFKQAGQETVYYWLIAAIFAAGAVVATLMRDPQRHSRIDRDE
jgi:MHS family alpha-ketoglutarate permease-like MFS transporter